MKIVVLLLIVLNISIMANKQEQNNYSLSSAITKSIALEKPILYIVISSTCPHCERYINGVITPKLNEIQKNYILAISDTNKGDFIPNDISFLGTVPSTYIISNKGKVLAGPIEGEIQGETLLSLLKNEMKKMKKP